MTIQRGTSRLDNSAAQRAAEAAAAKRAAEAAAKRAAEAAAKRAAEAAAKRAAEAAAKQAAEAAEGHVRRLGTGKLMEMGNAPWEQGGTDQLHANGKGTAKMREQASGAIDSLEAAAGDFKGAVLDPAKQALGAYKDAKKVFNTLGGRQIVGMLDRQTGVVGNAVQRAGAAINAVESAASNITKKAGAVTKRVDQVVSAGRAALNGEAAEFAVKEATKVATTAATKGATTAAVKVAGKAAARFVPGANIAVAALDAKKAYDTLRDPNASNWKKGTAVATAAFSAVAATNIPVVSQVAAGLSVVSDVASNINPAKAVDAVKDIGGKAVEGAKKFFSSF